MVSSTRHPNLFFVTFWERGPIESLASSRAASIESVTYWTYDPAVSPRICSNKFWAEAALAKAAALIANVFIIFNTDYLSIQSLIFTIKNPKRLKDSL